MKYLLLIALLGISAYADPISCPVINFQQSVESIGGNQFRVMFNPQTSMPVAWVDLHLNSIDGSPQLNVRMIKQGGNNAAQNFVFPNGAQNSLPITLMPGQQLSYSFTYCVSTPQGNVDCDSPVFQFQNQPEAIAEEPQRPNCPVISFSQQVVAASDGGQDLYKIVFTPQSDMNLAWVDLHLRIPGRDMENVRMMKTSANSFEYSGSQQPIYIPEGTTINYFFTYCVATPSGPVDCDTPMYSFTPQHPAPIEEPQPEPLKQETPQYVQPVQQQPPLQYFEQPQVYATKGVYAMSYGGGKGFGGPGPKGGHGGPGIGGPGGKGKGGPGFGGPGIKGGPGLGFDNIGYGGKSGFGYGYSGFAGSYLGGYSSPYLYGSPVASPLAANPIVQAPIYGNYGNYGYQQPIFGTNYNTAYNQPILGGATQQLATENPMFDSTP
jgi:hypothetical protein